MKINEFINNDDIKPGDVLMIESDGVALVGIVLGVNDSAVLIEGDTYPLDEQDDSEDRVDEVKQRLDPKCWKGYRKQGTKVKDGVRVNNCVKVNEDIDDDFSVLDIIDDVVNWIDDGDFDNVMNEFDQLVVYCQNNNLTISDLVKKIRQNNDSNYQHALEQLGQFGELFNEHKEEMIRALLAKIKRDIDYLTKQDITDIGAAFKFFGFDNPELDQVLNAATAAMPASLNEHDMDEEEEELYYDAINHMGNLYHALTDKQWSSAANYLSELGMLYQEAGVYLPDAIDMVTDRRVKMHIGRIYGLLDNNKEDVIRGILSMIKTGQESVTSISNLISVLDEFGAEWPELDALEAAAIKSLPNRLDEVSNTLSLQDIIIDPLGDEEMDKKEVLQLINKYMEKLDERKQIAIKLWMTGYTLDQIGDELGGLSRERVRQIIAKGIRILSYYILNKHKEFKSMKAPNISSDEFKKQVQRNWTKFTDKEKSVIKFIVSGTYFHDENTFDKKSFESAWKKMFKNALPIKQSNLYYRIYKPLVNNIAHDILKQMPASNVHSVNEKNKRDAEEIAKKTAWKEILDLNEAEYQGRTVQLGKPMRGDVRKYKVFVKDPKTGNIKKVNFGDPNMEIKRDDPARRKSFRARHGCGTPRASDRTKAAYWSCRMWSSKPVSKILKGK
jgi:hypothetical protein